MPLHHDTRPDTSRLFPLLERGTPILLTFCVLRGVWRGAQHRRGHIDATAHNISATRQPSPHRSCCTLSTQPRENSTSPWHWNKTTFPGPELEGNKTLSPMMPQCSNISPRQLPLGSSGFDVPLGPPMRLEVPRIRHAASLQSGWRLLHRWNSGRIGADISTFGADGKRNSLQSGKQPATAVLVWTVKPQSLCRLAQGLSQYAILYTNKCCEDTR